MAKSLSIKSLYLIRRQMSSHIIADFKRYHCQNKQDVNWIMNCHIIDPIQICAENQYFFEREGAYISIGPRNLDQVYQGQPKAKKENVC